MKINGRKTYIVALLMIISSVSAALAPVVQGDATLAQAISSIDWQIFLNGAGLATLRHGIPPKS